ncbi:hypothetical protein HC891_13285 [Candidatus Gracilibacteria bacterium]|nr:hypothetical protein [Candidatus Gracilibacteria bacterium]
MDERLTSLLRNTTPRQLLALLVDESERFDLCTVQRDELLAILHAWDQRALSDVPLRDAVLVDPKRGLRVYQLLAGGEPMPSFLSQIEALPLAAPPAWQPRETDLLTSAPLAARAGHVARIRRRTITRPTADGGPDSAAPGRLAVGSDHARAADRHWCWLAGLLRLSPDLAGAEPALVSP